MNLLSISALNSLQIQYLLDISTNIHSSNYKPLVGKNILFAFEKPSLRTKIGTEVAINQLGGNVIHVLPNNFFEGKVLFGDKHEHNINGRESLKDTVSNVSQWCDAIFARVYTHNTLNKISQYSNIPTVNALSDLHHPLQALADMRTIQEKFGRSKIKLAYIGDANNVAFSLFEAALKLGHEVVIASPKEYQFSEVQQYQLSKLSDSFSFTQCTNPLAAVKDADVIYTDTFVSMGEEDQFDEKIKAFKGFQVNKELISLAKSSCRFMHCLPAHRGTEVTDEVMDSDYSLIKTQAKNRMIVSKGVFTWLLNTDYEKEIVASERFQIESSC
jgi:ornithine carbamoyltransferase